MLRENSGSGLDTIKLRSIVYRGLIDVRNNNWSKK